MSNKFALDSLEQTLNKKEFEKAVECLSQAKKIAFFGVGGSSTAALDASNKFAKLGVTTGMNTDFHTVISYISNFTSEDALVIFSTSRNKRYNGDGFICEKDKRTSIGNNRLYKVSFIENSKYTTLFS
jgi:DNA-binding MurR/RpiR family transcriptional regulator